MVNKQGLMIFNNRYRTQILATFTAHILTFSHGISLGWLSPTLLILQSPQTPLNFIITEHEIAWIGSVFGIGALCGNITLLLLLRCLGRKSIMCILALPHMLFWILSYYAQSVEYLYVARFCAGLTSGGLYIVGPIFTSEITEKEVRGALTSIAMMFLSSGVLVGFTLPSYLDYHLIPRIIIFVSIIYVATMSYFPETPSYLLKRNRQETAKVAFDFYRNIKEQNLNEMHLTKVYNEFEELKLTKLQEGSSSSTMPISFRDFFNKSALTKFSLAFVIIIQNQFSSSFALLNYMSHIFAESGSTMDPNQCTIIIGLVQICGTLLASLLVERFGRKTLLLLSSAGMAIGMLFFGAFIQFTSVAIKIDYNWIPLVAVAFIIATASIGVIALTFTIIVEILPAKIRAEAQSITMMFCSLSMFTTLKLYPYFLFNFGIAITMYSCATCCFIPCLVLLIFLPETKGKSMTKD